MVKKILQDINNLNLQSIAEDEKSQDKDIDKELELQHESTIIDNLNNNN